MPAQARAHAIISPSQATTGLPSNRKLTCRPRDASPMRNPDAPAPASSSVAATLDIVWGK
jgi:hypothetical protein